MNNPVEDFLQRTSNKGIHHHTIEMDSDNTHDLDAWGNEWEADVDDDSNY